MLIASNHGSGLTTLVPFAGFFSFILKHFIFRREVNPTEWTSNTAPTQEVSDPVPSSTPAGMVEHDELD